MTEADVTGRRELRAWLSETMPGSAQRFEEVREHLPGEGRAKAYLLDVHVAPDDQHNRLATLFREAAGQLEAGFAETRDTQFYRMVRNDEVLFIDAVHPRFVVIHSTGLAQTTDKLVHDLVDSNPTIDRAWLASPFLGVHVPSMGRAIRHVVHFDSVAFWSGKAKTRDRFWEDDESNEPDPRRALGKRMALDLSGGIAHAPDLVDDLQQLPKWRNLFALARVDVAQSFADDTYLVERVFNWGKISGAGTNGEQHIVFVERLRQAYSRTLEYIEDQLRLSVANEQDRRVLKGHPISIALTIEPQHLELFVRRLFTGKRPFRMWGVPQKRSVGYYTVQALDLHVNRVISCEIFPTGMRLYLKPDSCANSVARLYTNLLSYVDAQAKIWAHGPDDALFDSGVSGAALQ